MRCPAITFSRGPLIKRLLSAKNTSARNCCIMFSALTCFLNFRTLSLKIIMDNVFQESGASGRPCKHIGRVLGPAASDLPIIAGGSYPPLWQKKKPSARTEAQRQRVRFGKEERTGCPHSLPPVGRNRSGMTIFICEGSNYVYPTQSKRKTPGLYRGLAADEGFEPSQTESESGVLPLH